MEGINKFHFKIDALKKFLFVVVLLCGATLATYYSLLLYIRNNAERDTKVKSDVIMVLGGTAIGGTSCYGPICKQGFVPQPRINPCLIARVEHGVSLYKNHYAPKILMTGGTDKESNVNEAETMQIIALDAGVPAEDILIEKESQSTYENFLFSKKILNAVGLRSVIIVSDPYHIPRAALIASKQHYTYSVSPAVESACWAQDKYKPFTNRDSRREVLAFIVYKLLNRL